MLGAVLIGLIQAFNEGLTWHAPGSDWTQSIVFAILILILVFRPEGPARRAHAGGRVSTQPGTQAATEQVHEQVGLRNQLRARWRALPTLTRAGISIGVELVVAVLFFFTLDHALGFAVATIAAIYWLRRVPLYPRVAGEAALVALFLIFGPRSLAVLLAVAFSISLAPPKYRDWVVPAAILLAAILYPFYRRSCSRSRSSACGPTSRRASTCSCSS